MRRAVLLALVCGVSTLSLAGEPQPRLPRDKLLLYRGADGKPATVKSVADWAKRRAEVVRGMESVMGKLPGDDKRCPLDMKVEEEVDGETFVRRLITYASEPSPQPLSPGERGRGEGGRVPAYLLIPKDVLAGKRKAPAVLCLHGTDNVIGHGTVVGLGKPNRGYALELAQRGYVTLAPNYPLLAKYQPDLKKLGWDSGTLKAVWDNMRGLDLLASLPFVNSAKGFGTIGHSLGGHNSVYTAVFDDRLKVIVSSCGLDSYLDYFEGNAKNWDPEKGWCQTRYMHKLADYKGRLADIPFDFHEMIGALAPRHTFIIAPTKDSNFRADSVDRIIAAARPVFKLHGHEERLRLEHPDCGHDFTPEMREAAYKLIDAVLAGKSTGGLTPAEFEKLHKELQPPKDELWRSIPWHVSIVEAQHAAAKAKKPIFVWVASGEPLGCG
ncbi:MAG: acetylxylan esterase [Gemmataceae bacterium]|nr:acetylxylan esterase [Gemmataceae bacterium]